MYVTLDGVMEAPQNWSFDFWGDALEAYAFKRLLAAEALLLGRATYQEFAAVWPSRTNDPFADRINSLPKFVVSKTLKQPEWNATVIDGDVVDEVRRLKQQPGGDLLIYGSRRLVNTLLDHDLIDDIRIWVYPIVVGEGEQLFDHPVGKTLKLVDTTTFDTGVVVLSYQPRRSEPNGPGPIDQG
jgi:dihydrofolate reductase